MIASLEHRRDRADGGHAGCEGEAFGAAFNRRDVAFERLARRILRPRVLVALVLSERLLDVSGRLINRGDDGARRRIGFLAGMQTDGAEASVGIELHRFQSSAFRFQS